MEITGKVTRKGDLEQVWANKTDKIDITVTEQDWKYPNSVNVSFWKEKAERVYDDVDVGDIVTLNLSITTTESGGRTYNNINGHVKAHNKSTANDVENDAKFDKEPDDLPF